MFLSVGEIRQGDGKSYVGIIRDLSEARETQEQEIKRIAENLRAIVCQRLVPSKDGKKAAAVEVMINTPRITDLILKQDFSAIRTAMEHGKNYHMQTFDQALIKLYEADIITPETAMEFADSRNNVGLHIRIRKGNIAADGEFALEEIGDEHPGHKGNGGSTVQAGS